MIVGKLQFLFTCYLGIQFFDSPPFSQHSHLGYRWLPTAHYLFLVTLYRVGFFLSVATLRQLIQPDLESRFIVRSQLGPSIQSGSSPSAGLQVVTQSTQLSKDYYPNWYRTHTVPQIRCPKQLNYRCMLLHPANTLCSTSVTYRMLCQWSPDASHTALCQGSRGFPQEQQLF